MGRGRDQGIARNIEYPGLMEKVLGHARDCWATASILAEHGGASWGPIRSFSGGVQAAPGRPAQSATVELGALVLAGRIWGVVGVFALPLPLPPA
jgi:hypothetical protein